MSVINVDSVTRNLTIAWLGGIPIAIINGAIRIYLYSPIMNELSAHQLSSITGILLFAIYFWIINKKWTMITPKQALLIGFNWLVLTIIFEFLFGHYIMGHSWELLLHDYNILEGRLWSLVLLWTFIGPTIIYRISKS